MVRFACPVVIVEFGNCRVVESYISLEIGI